jgi:hypothetical protein
MPALAASTAPSTEGCSGTSSARRVGRAATSLTKASNSSRWRRRCLVMRTRCLSARVRPSCKALKRPRLPAMPKDMKRSSPRYFCHCRMPTRFLLRSSSNMARRRAKRRSGSSRVPARESRIHPRISLRVAQEPSPRRSFFSDMGSLRLPSLGPGGANTLSALLRMVARTQSRSDSSPCTRLMKSSMKTST